MSWFARGAAALVGAFLALPATAQESAYTQIALGSCDTVPVDPDDPLTSGIWICDGFAGVPVRFAESDLRFFVSYGATAADQVAAHETLPPFNTVHTTLEWRVGEDGQPYATILRFFLDSGVGEEVPPGEVLVVTRIGAGGVCHIAYVDAVATRAANELARQLADALSPMFRCGKDLPHWFGEGGLE
jgi:hypothetical protein